MTTYGDNAPQTVHLGEVALEGAAARFARYLLDHGNTPTTPAVALGCGRDSGQRVLDTLRAAGVLAFKPIIANSTAQHRWCLKPEAFEAGR